MRVTATSNCVANGFWIFNNFISSLAVAGRGERPAQPTYPGVLLGVYSMLGVVDLRGRVWPPTSLDSRLVALSTLEGRKWSLLIELECKARSSSFMGIEWDRFLDRLFLGVRSRGGGT